MAGKCGAVGALMVGGRVVGQVVCELDAGHETETIPGRCSCGCYGATRPATPHRMILEWAPEQGGPDLDVLDPDESFDTDVPFDAPPAATKCRYESGHDGPHDVDLDELGEHDECGAPHPSPSRVAYCTQPAGHFGLHVDAGRPMVGQWS